MDNLEKLSTLGTQDEDKQNKKQQQKHNTICVERRCTPTNTNSVNKTRVHPTNILQIVSSNPDTHLKSAGFPCHAGRDFPPQFVW